MEGFLEQVPLELGLKGRSGPFFPLASSATPHHASPVTCQRREGPQQDKLLEMLDTVDTLQLVASPSVSESDLTLCTTNLIPSPHTS